MPEIAIIQAAAPQTPPQAASANNDSQGFSPHLEKALSNRNDQPSTEKNKINENQDVNTASESPRKVDTDKDGMQGAQETTKDAENKKGSKDILEQIIPIANGQDENVEKPMVNQQLNVLSPLFDFLSNNNVLATEETNDLPILQLDSPQQNLSEEGLPLTQVTANLEVPITGNDSSGTGPSLATKTEQNIFLQQIQKIIENSDESATPSITVTTNTLKERQETQTRFFGIQPFLPAETSSSDTPLPATTLSDFSDFSGFDIDGSLLLSANSPESPGEKTEQSLSAIRRTIQQQYFEGKIIPEIDSESQAPSEGGQQNNSFAAKTTENNALETTSTLLPDQNNLFAQSISFAQESQKTSTGGELSPITLPSGTIVQQEEVVRQITERFQIARRDFDTRVNIQLHPAELGEVHISLSVKEGTVRANVVASSQYAQEIIEKNMGKLRTVLENQGFTIDQIAVTSKSDTTGNFDLLDRQLFSKNDYTPASPKKRQNFGDLFVAEEFDIHQQSTGSEINFNI